MVIKLKLYKLFLPFAMLIAVITLRISNEFSSDSYYDTLKDKFKEELDIISLSKKFLGKLQDFYFEEVDYNVSTNEVLYEIDDNTYYVETDINYLISKNDGICVSINKSSNNYIIKLRCEGIIITYYDVCKPNIKIYDYVNTGEIICNLNYNETFYYMVTYEN